MARNFASATSDRVSLNAGATLFVSGPSTCAAIVQRASNAAIHVIFQSGVATSAARWQMRFNASDQLEAAWNTNTRVGSGMSTCVAADGWLLVAFTKTTGTTTPRFHRYKFSTRTWEHFDAASTVANSTLPSGTGSRIGADQTPASFFNGDIAAVGAWNVVLTDAQIESLASSLGAWFQNNPKGLWLLDQAATTTKVLDVTGNHADESAVTGTTVSTSSVPIFNRGVAPSVAAAATISTIAGTVTAALGRLSVTSSGTRSTTGTATAALGALTASTVGKRTTAGTVAAALGGLTATATGARVLAGTVAASLGSLTASATGTPKVLGTATAALGSLTVTASGTPKVTGTAAAALGTLSVSTSGTPSVTGTANAALAALSVTSAGIRSTTGTVAAPLGVLSVTTSGTPKVLGTVTASLGNLTVTVTGVPTVTATVTAALGSLIVTAASVPAITGTANVALGALTVTAVGTGASPNVVPAGGNLTKPRLHLGNFPGRKELAADGTLAYGLTLYGIGEPELPDNLTFPAFSGDGEICGEHRDLRSLTICTRSEMRGAGRLNTHPARNGTGTASEDADDDILVLLSL